eukprot:Skav212926  [mRNA]  locus=scaffold374:297064:298161:- [translate_table: standard]
MKVMVKHEAVLVNFKGYETLSRNNGVDPKGLIHALDFIDDVLELEPTAEIHPQPLKQGLLGLLTQKPQLNATSYGGSLWVHMRSERINVILFHIRRLARTGPTSACVNALSGMELGRLQNTLKKVVLSEEDGSKEPLQNGKNQSKPLEKGEHKESSPLRKGKQDEPANASQDEDRTPKKGKKLKLNPSDVSCDSQGFPNMLKSPPENTAGPSRLLKKRVGQAKDLAVVQAEPGLRSKLGLEGKTSKRPAAATKQLPAAKPGAHKKPASCKKTFGKRKHTPANKAVLEGKGPWVQLQKVTSNKSERAYVLGSKVAGETPKLIVQVSKKQSRKYSWVLDRLIETIEKENLSKEEALDLRTKLCKKYP